MAPLQVASGVAELRGSGVPTTKSVALLLVSVQPLPARKIAVVDDGAGAGLPSAKLAVEP